jgi:hypothetical protein
MKAYSTIGVPEIAGIADAGENTIPTTYAALGGNRISQESLSAIRRDVRILAKESGYPERTDRDGQQRFDRKAALFLRDIFRSSIGEAIRPDTWQFISVGLLPDVVAWRFPPSVAGQVVTESRFLGGNRNCFGRLWQRAVVLYDFRLADPDTALKNLKEDNFVAILERSAFATMPNPCREVARAFLLRRSLARVESGHSIEEAFLRDAMCRVVRSTGYVAFWSLSNGQLEDLVGGLFDDSLKAFGIRPRPAAELLLDAPNLTFVNQATSPRAGSRVGAIAGSAPFRVNVKFDELDNAERTEAVWQVLLGRGADSVEQLVRTAATALKQRGMLTFERLREDGTVYLSILSAIERGVRSGKFDIPARGQRRAIVKSWTEIPEAVLQDLLLQRIYTGVREDLAISVLSAEISARLGFADRRAAQKLATDTLEHLKQLGKAVTKGGMVRSNIA